MGTYDPPPGTTDDENQMGNIIGALLQFPTDYTFSVVGKTNDGDAYASDVKSLMESILGSDARMETRVVPRGTKFTRVSVKVSVESAAMITSIYEELDSMELTVMKF
jgi:putative lipoic acid-binding regulatory protein